ncbi:MAG: potassium channel family protein [Planctomycetaceae bacterium]
MRLRFYWSGHNRTYPIIVEGWTLSDCFFMTVITISTVGYGETQSLTEHGRWYTSGLIFVSLVSMTGWTAILTSFIVESDLHGHFQKRRTARMIEAMKNHTIVCGSGLLGQAIVDRLMRKRADVVLITADSNQINTLGAKFKRLQIIEGNPASELNLAKANVLNAAFVVAATDSEVNNLLIGITCKDLATNIKVIAESNDMAIANRMRKSGIDEVISPSQLGGAKATELILTH